MDNKNDLGLKRVSKNAIVNILNFLVNAFVGFLLPQLIISNSGLQGYGVVQLALGLSTYIGLFSTSLNQANNRFVAISFLNNDYNKTFEVFDTIITIYIYLSFLLLPAIIGLSIFSDVLFKTDGVPKADVVILFLTIFFYFSLIMAITVFNSTLYAKNRLDRIQFLNIVRNIIKIVILALLFRVFDTSIKFVGITFFISALITFLIAMRWFIKDLPGYNFHIQGYNKETASLIGSLSLWTMINHIGTLLFVQADVVVINIFLGNSASGEYGVIFQLSNLLRNLATVLSVVIAPIILIKYSNAAYDSLRRYILNALKYQGLFCGIITGFMIVYNKSILRFWLGADFVYLSNYVVIAVFHFSLTQAIRPLYSCNTAYNKLKVISFFSLLFGVLHVATSILLINYFSMGIYASLISGAFYTIVLNVFILPIYVAQYMTLRVIDVYKQLMPAAVTMLLTILVGFWLNMIIVVDSIFALIFSGISLSIIVTLLVFLLFVKKEEKKLIFNIIRGALGKRKVL